LKTKRGAAKRFSKTSSGKLKRSKAFKRHRLTKKNRKRKRRLGKSTLVSAADHKRMTLLVPSL
jgi:large subunit ribosomal protein L35